MTLPSMLFLGSWVQSCFPGSAEAQEQQAIVISAESPNNEERGDKGRRQRSDLGKGSRVCKTRTGYTSIFLISSPELLPPGKSWRVGKNGYVNLPDPFCLTCGLLQSQGCIWFFLVTSSEPSGGPQRETSWCHLLWKVSPSPFFGSEVLLLQYLIWS